MDLRKTYYRSENRLRTDTIEWISTLQSVPFAKYMDQQSTRAIERLDSGDATGAIVEASKLTVLPHELHTPLPGERSGPAEAAIARLLGREPRKPTGLIAPELPSDIHDTIERAQFMLYGREAVEWASALASYNDTYQFDNASVAGIELARAHGAPSAFESTLTPPQLSSYAIAATSARHHLSSLTEGQEAFTASPDIAATRSHLVIALHATAMHYLSLRSPSREERKVATQVIYEIDDTLYPSWDFLHQAYTFLASLTSWSERKTRSFYEREAYVAKRNADFARMSRHGTSFSERDYPERPSKDRRPVVR